jgi:hypothetical protein
MKGAETYILGVNDNGRPNNAFRVVGKGLVKLCKHNTKNN